jgi:hypothetical protein
MTTKLTKQEIRKRIQKSGKRTAKYSAEDFLIDYSSAAKISQPDMKIIEKLYQKKLEEKSLKVNFKLNKDQFDNLSVYFGVPDLSGNELVQKALTEFIRITTQS